MEVPVTDAPTATDTPVAAEAVPPKPAAAPVMDVRPPQAEAAPVREPKAEEAPKPADDKETKKPEKVKKEKPPKVVTPKKPRQPGVGTAIFASVVIVLGLAALAVYAYLKTQR
jgi:hypothetical protein